MRPRPATTVITHGFPVGELDAGEFADREAGVIPERCRQLRAGESRPRATAIIDDRAAIHAAAVTAAAWIAALPVLIR